MQNNGSNYLEITIQYPQKNKSYLSSWYYRTGSFFVPTCNRKQTLPKRKMKVQTNTLPIKPRHYAKTAIVTLPLRTPESERYLLTLPYIFSAHLAHKARKTKPKLSHAIKGYIPKIAWFRHLSLSIQAQKKKKQQLRTSRSGVRVPSSAPNEKDTAFAVSFFFWRACLLKLRAARSPLRDGTVVLKTFHWNVFLTHSTSSAPNEKDTAFAVSFFFWCACPRRRRAMRSPLRDGTVALKTFHWNVFSTRSTSSARGRRAVCSFLWEIKLRRKRRRCLKARTLKETFLN